MGLLGDIVGGIWNALKAIWNLVKQITRDIVNFFADIVNFFRQRKDQLRDKSKIAIAIKQKMDSGDYAVANCIFDTDENELVDPEHNAEIIKYGDLDQQTKNSFKGKDMLVLK